MDLTCFSPAPSNLFIGEEVGGGDVLQSPVASPVSKDEVNSLSANHLSPYPLSPSGQSDHDSGYSASPVFSPTIELSSHQNHSNDILSVRDSVTELFPDLI